jgi:hypothetical protein
MNIGKADVFTAQGDFLLPVVAFRLASSWDHILHTFNLCDCVLFITEQYLHLFSSETCQNMGCGDN